jgi:hypothetical protein
MAAIETMAVYWPGKGMVRINKDDFDPAVHAEKEPVKADEKPAEGEAAKGRKKAIPES